MRCLYFHHTVGCTGAFPFYPTSYASTLPLFFTKCYLSIEGLESNLTPDQAVLVSSYLSEKYSSYTTAVIFAILLSCCGGSNERYSPGIYVKKVIQSTEEKNIEKVVNAKDDTDVKAALGKGETASKRERIVKRAAKEFKNG